MLNKVILMGRMAADPELKTTPGGVSVATFRLAVERNYAPEGEKRQADFINCVAWRNTGEFIVRHFGKGALLAVEGSIQTRNYEDKNGNKRTAVEVIVNQAHFCGGGERKEAAQAPAPNRAEPERRNQQSGKDYGKAQAFGDFKDYDLPPYDEDDLTY